MMRAFALIAILPAALGTAAPVQAGTIAVPLCTGDGALRTVPLPSKRGKDPASCPKGCHAGPTRKRAGCGRGR